MTSARLTSDLVADGFSYGEVTRSARRGDLIRLRRGAYAPRSDADTGWEELHRARIIATMRMVNPDAVVSHESAAVLHDLPLLEQPSSVTITRERSGGRKRPQVHLHAAGLDQSELVQIDGLAVTTPARTVVDLGRSTSFLRAVVVGDSALRSGMEPLALAGSLDLGCRRPGISKARRVAAFIDGGSESPGESVSRTLFAAQGLPRPVLQFEVYDGSTLAGRSDFCWPEHGTLGEFDGKIKYSRFLREGETVQDVVFREKQREDHLRDLGWQVVRWTWSDLRDASALAIRLQRAFRRTTFT